MNSSRMVAAIILVCLASLGSPVAGASPEPAGPAAVSALSTLAEDILTAAGARTGLCLDLGCGSGELALEILRRSRFFVHALETDDSRVEAARRRLDADGFYARRAAVEKGSLTRLPYPDYCANLIVRGDLLAELDRESSWNELVRVLRPGGLAWVGQGGESGKPGPQAKLTADALTAQLVAAGVRDFQIVQKNGLWARIRRPRPEGMADWSHGRWGTPGNNPCVDDKLVKPPFQTLWIAGPNSFTKFGLPLASAGRVLLRHGGMTRESRWTPSAEGDLVQAFDAFNGTLLWERRLDETAGDGFVAVGSDVFAAGGRTLFAIDAADGAIRWGLPAEKVLAGMKTWGHYASVDGRVVAILLDADVQGPPAAGPQPAGKALIGLSARDAAVLWKVQPAGGVRSIAVGAGRAFFSTADDLAAVDIATGREAWKQKTAGLGSLRFHGQNLYTDAGVFSAADGQMIARQRFAGVLVGDLALAGGLKGVSAVELKTGQKVNAFPVPRDPYCPKTGIPDGCSYMYGRCIAPTASTHCYFFSYGGTVIGDLIRNEIFPCESFRANCRTGVIVGNGLAYNSPSGCGCSFAVRAGISLVPVDEAFYWGRPESNPPPRLEKGPAYQDRIESRDRPEDWPCYRHDPARSNVTDGAVNWPLAAKWKTALPGRLTPPVVAGGGVFVGSDDHCAYALDAATGRIAWRYFTGGEITASPAFWQGRLYVGSLDGWVYCLRADTGSLIWRFRGATHERKMLFHGRPRSLWPIAGGVIVENGVVQFYAGYCSHDRVFVVSLDGRTGEILWQNDRSGRAVELTGPEGGISPHGVSPSGVIAAFGDILYVPQGMFAPAAFSRTDGKLLWWGRRGDSRQRSNIEVQNVGGPDLAVSRGLLFVGGRNPLTGSAQPFVAVDARTGRLWGADDPRLFEKAGRDETGLAVVVKQSVFGTKPIRFGQDIAPVVADGGVFTFGYRGNFVDLDRFLQTQFGQAPANLNRWSTAPPSGALIVAGDKVLVAGAGRLTALARADGRTLGTVQLGTEGDAAPNGLAAAAGNVVLVTGAGEVACFGHP